MSKFIQFVLAAIVGTALGLATAHWYFGLAPIPEANMAGMRGVASGDVVIWTARR